MAILRTQHGMTLSESLETCQIVKTIEDIEKILNKDCYLKLVDIEIKDTNGFDPRIGWFVQLVMARFKNDPDPSKGVVGYLSEPL